MPENTIKAKTCVGRNIKFDISKEACEPFGFFHNERVKTPCGNATVVGVAKDRYQNKLQLWFLVDGEEGAACWGWVKTKGNVQKYSL